MAVANHPGGGVHHPTDHDLIALVLRPMASAAAAGQHHGLDAGGGFVHLADVYSVAPERLAERYAPAPGNTACWYYLCPARRRYRPAAAAGALGELCWASDAGAVVRPVTGPDGRRVGLSRVLFYGAGTAAPWAAFTRRGWCMVEFALDDDQDGGGAGDFVLCKLFRSSSATATAIPALVSSCKRKATVPEAPPSVRQQLMQRSF